MAVKRSETTHASWLRRLLSLAPLHARRHEEAEVAFPPDFLGLLERLRLTALRAVGGGLHEGHRLGAYKGGQLEFHGHRDYTPGDELRYMDWNSYARLGRPYVKEFAREEAGVLHLLLDATPSMSLGHPSKWTFARRIAALFAHVATASKDVANIHIFRGGSPSPSGRGSGGGPQAEREQFRCGARRRMAECLAFLEAAKVATADESASPSALPHGERGNTGLGNAVAAFLRGGPVRGRCVIVSDFWQDEPAMVAAVSRLAAARFDVAAIHVLAAEELKPAAEGELLARALEDEGEIETTADDAFPMRYAQALDAHCQTVENAFRRRGGNYLLTGSDAPMDHVLIATLRQRRWLA